MFVSHHLRYLPAFTFRLMLWEMSLESLSNSSKSEFSLYVPIAGAFLSLLGRPLPLTADPRVDWRVAWEWAAVSNFIFFPVLLLLLLRGLLDDWWFTLFLRGGLAIPTSSLSLSVSSSAPLTDTSVLPLLFSLPRSLSSLSVSPSSAQIINNNIWQKLLSQLDKHIH